MKPQHTGKSMSYVFLKSEGTEHFSKHKIKFRSHKRKEVLD